MLSLQRLLRYWEIDNENTGFEEWNDCDNYPEYFTIYLKSTRDKEVYLTISFCMNKWKLKNVSLWQNDGIGMKLRGNMMADYKDLDSQLERWSLYPQNYKVN